MRSLAGRSGGMSGTGRHASASAHRFPTRLGVAANSAGARPAARLATRPAARPAAAPVARGARVARIARADAVPALAGLRHLAARAPSEAAAASWATMPLVLTGADHKDCPAAATACVDLTRHITWLQANGRTTFGPVQGEPGKPGGGHETPRGTFQVDWKAGPSLVSNIYHEPMPWATFFAPGGIAFHGGSLTAWSHGCVHLTIKNAHYYNEHLPIGAEVVVF